MRKADIVSGTLLVVFGVVMLFVIIPAEIGGSSSYGLPPDFFPRLVVWMTTVLAAALVIHRMLLTRLAPRTPEAGDPPPMRWPDFAFIGVAAPFLLATHVVMSRLGFIPAAAVIILAAGSAMGELRNPLRLVLVAALAPVAVFFIFRHALSVFLPS